MFMNYDSIKPGERIERKSVDKTFMVDVVNQTTIYTGKKLLRSEIEGLVHYINDLDFNLLKHDSNDVLVDKIAKNFSKQLSIKTGSVINTHEVMKRHIGAIPHDGSQSLYQDVDCPPIYNVHHVNNPKTLGVRGDSGQNTPYRQHTNNTPLFNNPDVCEGFGSRARNTHETNAIYTQNDRVSDTMGSLCGDMSTYETHQLENSAKTFSSIRDKYPRIAKQKVQNIYLLLDSKFRNLSTDKNVFKWTVLHSANTTQGTVNTLSDQIHNIVNIQFDRCNIPYAASADNVYKKISLYIEEFSSMSVLINTNRRYHMIFDSEIQGNQIQLTPLVNDEGRFRFHTPINILDTITIRFQSPFSPVEFLQDRFNITVTSLNPTQSLLTFATHHQVSDGELVHMEGFNTLAPSVDSIQIDNINREVGHIVTYIDNFVLRIEAGLDTITPDINNIVDCFIASRRLIIPIRMEYII